MYPPQRAVVTGLGAALAGTIRTYRRRARQCHLGCRLRSPCLDVKFIPQTLRQLGPVLVLLLAATSRTSALLGPDASKSFQPFLDGGVA